MYTRLTLKERLYEGCVLFVFLGLSWITTAIFAFDQGPLWSSPHLRPFLNYLHTTGLTNTTVAEMLFHYFGWTCYGLPCLLLITLTVYCFCEEEPLVGVVFGVLGSMVMLLSLTGLTALYASQTHPTLYWTGALGFTIIHYLLRGFPQAFLAPLLSAGICIGFTLATGYSSLSFFRNLKRLALGLCMQFRRYTLALARMFVWGALKIIQGCTQIFRLARDLSRSICKGLALLPKRFKVEKKAQQFKQLGNCFSHLEKNSAELQKTLAEGVLLSSIKATDTIPTTDPTAPKPSQTMDDHQKRVLIPTVSADARFPKDLSLLTPEPDEPPAQPLAKEKIERALSEYQITAQVTSWKQGPRLTRYNLDLAAGEKVSRLIALQGDLARSLHISSISVVEQAAQGSVGMDIPNPKPHPVYLSTFLSDPPCSVEQVPLAIPIGKEVVGRPYWSNLAKMPHLLIAGTTGSGKSVGIHALLLSLVYRLPAERLRLILIDPKMLELSCYEGLPHLISEVVTDLSRVPPILKWCIQEMEDRYLLMSKAGVRNIQQYQNIASNTASMTMPYIVLVIDEFADLIAVTGKQTEGLLMRLAQKSRAAGIHLILATQRPSVDIITGTLKANIPARLAFTVASRVDSRTILDRVGAESLLGEGDLLFLPPSSSSPIRLQAPFVTEHELQHVTQYLRVQNPNYLTFSETA